MSSSSDDYWERENLLREARARSRNEREELPALSLDSLAALMKKRSLGRENLSCIYFAGAIGDHPYFLRNNVVAIGISVLPEDGRKAALWKRHPHQEEIIVTLEGRIHLETKKAGEIRTRTLGAGELALIGKGHCHRITPVNGEDAVFLFLKTNPATEPRGEDC